MYEIYADNVCLYSDTYLPPESKAIDPKLTIEDNAAGQLTFKLPKTNAAYSSLKRLSSEVKVYREGAEIWSGRVINEKQDFWENRDITVEGELAYLNDTTQPPRELHNVSPYEFLRILLDTHNAKVDEEWKKFYIGAVGVKDPNDSLYRFTNWESTLQCINDKLVDRLGGHLRIRKVNGKRYLDWLADYPNSTTQIVQFGSNLLDYTKSWDLTELATVVLPLGASLEESPIEQLTAYTTVESVNGGSPYVQSSTAVGTYGWIEVVVNWDDVTEPSNLLRKAKDYLQEAQFETMVLEVTAMDLHYLNPEIESIDFLDKLQCISDPHGMNAVFPVAKMDIPMDKPENTIYTLNSTHKMSLTGTVRTTNNDIMNRLNAIPPASAILKQARDKATELINTATTGYVTIVHNEYGAEEFIISEIKDYTKASRMWVWNMNGLGYTKDGRKSYEVAITMDGEIVANFITTGTMSADRIRGGILESYNKNVVFDMQNGIFTMKKGSIDLGNGNFTVNDQGYVYAQLGEFKNLQLTDVFAENITLQGQVNFAQANGKQKYMYLRAEYDPDGGNQIAFYKSSGALGKIHCGRLNANAVVCDGGVEIDLKNGTIKANRLDVSNKMVIDGVNIINKIKELENAMKGLPSSKEWKEAQNKISNHVHKYYYYRQGNKEWEKTNDAIMPS